MGSRITDFVSVTISRESAKLTRAGFGTPLIIGTVSAWDDRVKTFSVPDDLLEEGLTASDAIYKAAVKLYSQSVKPERFKVGRKVGEETFAEAYAACKEADPDFYGVAIMSTTASDISGVAQAVEADTRLFYYRTKDSNNLNGGQGIGATLKTAGYNRSFGVYSTDDNGYAEMAAMAIELTRDPGSYTLKFQPVSGVTAESLSGSDITALKTNNLNFVEAVGGYNIISSEAVVASGEYVDNIRFTDWLQVRMTEDVFQALINAGETAGKLPYTREGYAVIEAAIRKRLALGVAVGGIEEGTVVVNMPDPDDADPADKAARTVRLTKVFTAKLRGAVHKTIITGDLVI